ncbi:anti-sigma factor family protein [Streptomyces axinellae]|uniref:Putative zinc-finger domain-containing protein n=1 Tax=Streptomyces axinellae TaxID=552788 RepID=A0ABN3PTB5_9ACTN
MTPAEHHLGDRLAALVDGELGHDARERVLSHLATCRSCKAEADAQRRLKNVFADTAPPPPSDGLLARLQGLPAGGDACAGRTGGSDRGADGPGPGAPSANEEGAPPMAGLPGGPQRSPWAFDYLPVGRGTGAGRGPLTPQRGFRIHEVRVERAERSASRGRRFAFAAAGAFSLAALALGGSLASGSTGGAPVAKGDGGGASASPVRTAPAGSGTTSRDSRRRTPGELRGGVLSASAAAAQTAATFAAGAARGSGVASSARGGTAAAAPSLIAALAAPLGPSPRLSPATGVSGSYGPSGSYSSDGQGSGSGTFTSLTSPPSLTSRGAAPLMAGVRPAAPSYDPSSLRAFPGRAPLTPSPTPGR